MSLAPHSKAQLRQIFKAKRQTMTPEEIAAQSQLVNQNFISHLLPQIHNLTSPKSFSLYLPSYGEVSTSLIAEYFDDNHITFSYPKIVKMHHPLDFIVSQKHQQYEKSSFFPRILEPIGDQKIAPDVVIMPLLAFDRELSRLGMGGGFFDRTIAFLEKTKHITKIGLAYDYQGFDSILPIEETDQKLDFIVTESQIIS